MLRKHSVPVVFSQNTGHGSASSSSSSSSILSKLRVTVPDLDIEVSLLPDDIDQLMRSRRAYLRKSKNPIRAAIERRMDILDENDKKISFSSRSDITEQIDIELVASSSLTNAAPSLKPEIKTAAYVYQLREDAAGGDQLVYINNGEHKVILMGKQGKLDQFVEKLRPTDKIRKLSPDELKKIEPITGHVPVSEMDKNEVEEIEVEFRSKNKCNFFERVIPPAAAFFYTGQLISNLFLDACQATASLSEMLPDMAESSAKSLGLVIAILNIIYSLSIFAYMYLKLKDETVGDLGATIDNGLHCIWRKCCGPKLRKEPEAKSDNDDFKDIEKGNNEHDHDESKDRGYNELDQGDFSHKKSSLTCGRQTTLLTIKILVAIGGISYFLYDLLSDIQSYWLIDIQTERYKPSSMFAPSLLLYSQVASFGANQPSDLSTTLGSLIGSFKNISNFFKTLPKPGEGKTVAELRAEAKDIGEKKQLLQHGLNVSADDFIDQSDSYVGGRALN